MPWTHNERPREAVCLFSDGSSSAPGMSAVSLFCPGLLDLPLLPLFPFYFKRTRGPSLRPFPFSLLPRGTVPSNFFLSAASIRQTGNNFRRNLELPPPTLISTHRRPDWSILPPRRHVRSLRLRLTFSDRLNLSKERTREDIQRLIGTTARSLRNLENC